VFINQTQNGITLKTNTMSENIHPETPEYKGKEAYVEAGADYVISSIDELRALIKMINSRLVFRESQFD
jgi:hypothetical protein